MILLDSILHDAVNPGLALLPPKMDTKETRVQMLAIGLQESEFMTRVQRTNSGKPGPARSYWQMERGGGVLGVLNFPGTKFMARDVCEKRGVAPNSLDVWTAMEHDDVLGAAFARLLLWTDPLSMPRVTDAAGAWALYLRVWRPGKPHPDKWAANHARARSQVIA